MMNDQIKALMGQTLDEKFSGTWSTMDMQDLQKFTERFAELILEEIMQELIINGHDDAFIFLNKHFGVEE